MFIEAARNVGVPEGQILRLHLLPNLIGPLATLATFEMSAMILTRPASDSSVFRCRLALRVGAT